MPSFARASDGQLTGLSDTNWKLKVSRADVQRSNLVANTTGAGDSASEFSSGDRFRYDITGEATLQDGSGSVIRLTENMGSISGTLMGRTSVVALEKLAGDPIDVTAAEDAAPLTEWAIGLPRYDGAANGFLQPSEQLLDSSFKPNDTLNHLTLPLGGNLSIDSDIVVGSVGKRPRFRGDGPIEVSFQFRFTGAPNHPNGSPFDSDTQEITLDLDNGQQMTGTFLLTRLRCDLDYRKTSPVPFEFEGIMTGQVTFS